MVPFVLAGCTAVSVLSTDLLTPSIPFFPDVFNTDVQTAQLVVGISLLAYAIAQLVHGPLSDRFGRRRLLICAFPVFALVSAACTFATSMEAVLLGRFLQGLFASVPSVVVILIIRELYGSKDGMRVMALYGAAMGIAPAVGPLIGGHLHAWFGWTASFWTVAGLACITLVAFWRWVPETLPADANRRVHNPLGDYLTLLKRPNFIRLALAVALTFGAFFAYVSTAPVVFIDRLGVPVQYFGLTYMPVIMAFIAGNILFSKLSRAWESEVIIQVAMRLMLLGMVAMIVPLLLGYETVSLLILPMLLYAVGFAAMMAAGQIAVLDQVPDLPQGPASAVLGFVQLGSAAVASSISSLSYSDGALTMALTMTAFVTAGAILLASVQSSLAKPISQE